MYIGETIGEAQDFWQFQQQPLSLLSVGALGLPITFNSGYGAVITVAQYLRWVRGVYGIPPSWIDQWYDEDDYDEEADEDYVYEEEEEEELEYASDVEEEEEEEEEIEAEDTPDVPVEEGIVIVHDLSGYAFQQSLLPTSTTVQDYQGFLDAVEEALDQETPVLLAVDLDAFGEPAQAGGTRARWIVLIGTYQNEAEEAGAVCTFAGGGYWAWPAQALYESLAQLNEYPERYTLFKAPGNAFEQVDEPGGEHGDREEVWGARKRNKSERVAMGSGQGATLTQQTVTGLRNQLLRLDVPTFHF